MNAFRTKHMLLPLAVIALAVVATGCKGKRHHKGEIDQTTMERRALERTGWALDDIDATDAQREKVNGIVKGMIPDAWAMHEKRKGMGEQLKAELLAEKPDAKLVHGMVDTTSVDITAMAHKLADTALEIHAVLDADQREELVDQWPEGKTSWDGSWMLDAGINRGLDELEATPKQEELVLSKKDMLEAEADGLLKHKAATRALLIKQAMSDKPDLKVVHSAIDSASKVYTAFAHKATDAVLEVAATLTPAQRTIIQQKMAEWKKK